uniref:UBR-type domain-containing protein n=1 Tax=Glossina brevipalpis TaxID=37001 RepID=A0A1A9WGV3_9MUSC
MINTVGVCSVCARVRHKGHDVSYAKYGNFFCDCGAKEDGSCQALSRRLSAGVECQSSPNDYHKSSYAANSAAKRGQIPPFHVSHITTTKTQQCPLLLLLLLLLLSLQLNRFKN